MVIEKNLRVKTVVSSVFEIVGAKGRGGIQLKYFDFKN